MRRPVHRLRLAGAMLTASCHPPGRSASEGHAGFAAVVAQIVVLDAVFSLDAVITAVGMVEHLGVMMAAVVISIGVMILASKALTRFVNAHATVVVLCLSFLLMIGLSLVAEGLGFHIPKGYLYAAIGFSIVIETLNQFARRNFPRRRRACPSASAPRSRSCACSASAAAPTRTARPKKRADRKKAIAAALSALASNTAIDASESPAMALRRLRVVDWEAVDVDDALFDVLERFLARSPEFYLPTTPAMWLRFVERIQASRALALPLVDLAPQPVADPATTKAREGMLRHATRAPKPTRPSQEAGVLAEKIMVAGMTVNFALDKLFKYRSPRLLDAFEVRALGGNANNIHAGLEEERLSAEEHHFGTRKDMIVEPRHRPRYAAVNYKEHASGAAAPNDYGLSYMVLSDKLRPHCTITIGDSFDVIGTSVDGAFPYDKEGVLRLAQTLVAGDDAASFSSTDGYRAADPYLDVQIHTDVDMREHVEAIYVSTVEMETFGMDIGRVNELIRKLTGGVFVHQA